jgi:hypothetical protein
MNIILLLVLVSLYACEIGKKTFHDEYDKNYWCEENVEVHSFVKESRILKCHNNAVHLTTKKCYRRDPSTGEYALLQTHKTYECEENL